MGQRCCICKHDKRLEIDRDIVKGVPHLKIGKKYGVSNLSVRNHAKNHLSRQMLKSDEMKSVAHSKNLFKEVQELIQRTKNILDKAEEDDRPMISLGAIRELRKTYEFLIKFQVYMAEAQREEEKEGEYGADMEAVRAIGNRLSLERGCYWVKLWKNIMVRFLKMSICSGTLKRIGLWVQEDAYRHVSVIGFQKILKMMRLCYSDRR